MDKEEYRVRLESIRMLAEQRDFHAAAQVADTIDWKRVKSVRTLLMIAEIYEADAVYEKANRILQFAYWRSHTSKTVLYRLTEINIRLGNFSDALKYCDEFELLSPKDSTRFLLRYKLLTAREEPLENRIRLLEQYRETDFTEKWAYELATLYYQNGQFDKCAQLCDDMIVWFAEGKYVTRAKELRQRVKPQEAKSEPAESKQKESRMTGRNTVELTSASSEAKQAPAFRENREEEVRTQLADSIRAVVAGIRTGEENVGAAGEIRPEESFSYKESIPARKVKALEPETIGRTTIAPPPIGETADGETQITIDDYMNGSDKSGEAGEFDELMRETRANLASAVASGKYEKIKTQPQETSDVPAGQMSFEDFLPEVNDEEAEMDPLEKLYGKETDETLGLTRAFNLQEEVAKELDRQNRKKESESEEARRRRAVEQTLRSAGVKLPDMEEKPEEPKLPETAEEPETAELPEEETVLTEDAEQSERDPEDLADALFAVTEAELAEHEKSSVQEMLDEAEYVGEAEKEKAAVRKESGEGRKGGIGAWLKRFLASTQEPEEPEEAEDAADQAENAEGGTEAAPEAEAAAKPEEPLEIQEEETPAEAEVITEAEETAEQEEETAKAEEAVPEDSSDALIEEIIEGPEELQKVPVEPRAFDDTERDIFSYFTRIPGMSEQVTMALADIHNNAGDKTSRSGNVMIIGRQGAGKTRLSDALMIAAARDLGMKAVRCAKIIASDFNEKNPAEVVSKMRGGFLVIEGAGELTDGAVEKLLRAMEFRTDSLVVMLEDEKADLKALLLRHPEIEEKFTSTIVIPVFTNDELVTFAKTYAREKGYRMDEMGILALYTMIGDNQSATEPVTVGKVREMMDAAIEKADSGTRKIGRRFSKRAVDKDGRILLREKDFDL